MNLDEEVWELRGEVVRLTNRMEEARTILRQAQSFIIGDLPEDITSGEAEDDTLSRIRGFLNSND